MKCHTFLAKLQCFPIFHLHSLKFRIFLLLDWFLRKTRENKRILCYLCESERNLLSGTFTLLVDFVLHADNLRDEQMK